MEYQWMVPDLFLGLISEEPILKTEYPRYKAYHDQLKCKGTMKTHRIAEIAEKETNKNDSHSVFQS